MPKKEIKIKMRPGLGRCHPEGTKERTWKETEEQL
jgi:hypothetical protein